MTRYHARFRKIANSLHRVELTRRTEAPTWPSTEDAWFASEPDERRFLDFYSEDGIRLALDRYGVYAALERRGWVEPSIETRAEDNRHLVFVEAAHPNVDDRRRILELAMRRDFLHPANEVGLPAVEPMYEVLTVDWMHLADPSRRFTPDRPRLPGQRWPGLGMGERILELIYRIVDRLELDAMLTVGERFHNAALYVREMPFFEPFYAAQLSALEDELFGAHDLNLAQAAWAIEWGLVRREDGQPFRWRGEAMLHAHASSLKRYFNARSWRARVDAWRVWFGFSLDRAAFDARWAEAAPALTGALSPDEAAAAADEAGER